MCACNSGKQGAVPDRSGILCVIIPRRPLTIGISWRVGPWTLPAITAQRMVRRLRAMLWTGPPTETAGLPTAMPRLQIWATELQVRPHRHFELQQRRAQKDLGMLTQLLQAELPLRRNQDHRKVWTPGLMSQA